MSTRLITIAAMTIVLLMVAGCGQETASLTPMPPTEALAQPATVPTQEPAQPAEASIPTAEAAFITELDTLPGDDCESAGLPELACQGVSTNDAWAPVIRDFNGAWMVLVPAGCFRMGYEDNLPEERPVHRICFDRPFWIDLTETTVAAFAQFLNDQEDPVDSYNGWLEVKSLTEELPIQLTLENGIWKPLHKTDNQPVENVTWIGATDYCAWRDARLPSEAEWEYAARGPESWLYPWGNEYTSENLLRSDYQMPDVGSIPQGASWVGALDLSGSLYEWTSSLYKPYPYDPNDGREAPLEEDFGDRVFRGCPWYHSVSNEYGPRLDNVSATARHDNPPNVGLWYFGFRCARPFNP
jgi:formylglycine-generating enzyme required for sulfatase activity